MGMLKFIAALLAVLLVTISTSVAQDEALIMFSGAQTLRFGRDYSFAVISSSLRSSIQANFTFTGFSYETGKIEPLKILNQRIPSNSFKTFKFKTSSLDQGYFYLSATYYDPFKKEYYQAQMGLYHRMTIQFSCYVHADKGIYKGGDTAKFSIFCIDSETKPYKPKWSFARIMDPSNNEIKKFENLTFVKGKSKIEFSIADKAVDGEWRFELLAEDMLYLKNFEVKKYVLPTHSIKIEIPRRLLFDTEKSIQIKLIATYTFGEFIEGEAVVTFWEYKYDYNPSTAIYEYVQQVLFTKTVLIDSAVEVIDVHYENDLKIYYPRKIFVSVKFTENLTKKVIEAEETIDFLSKFYELIYSGDESYVDGQTFKFKVSLKEIETGEPAPEGVTIYGNVYASNDCYYDEFYNHYCPEQNEDFFLNFDNVTDASGSINFQFKIRNFSSVSFSIYSLNADYVFKNLKRSGSSGFKTEILTKRPKVGSPVSISIYTGNSINKRCSFQMMSKDVLVSQGQVAFVNQSAVLTFTPSLLFFPQTDIVFFVVGSEQITTSKVILKLEDKLLNHVNLELSKSEVKPGQNVTLKISSKALSTVSIFGIDSASTLLRSGNGFSKTDVMTSILIRYHSQYYLFYMSDIESFLTSKMFVLKTKITYLVKLTPTTSTTTTTTSTQTEPTSTQTDPTSTQAEPTSTPSEPTLTQTDPWYGASDGSSSPSQEPNPTSEGPLEPTSEEPSSSSYTTDLPPEPQINSQARIPLLATRRNFVEVIDIADVQVTRRKRFANGTFDPVNAEAFASFCVPESVTTFDFTAVAMNNIYGMGITERPTSLKIFKKFFIQMTLPYNCKRTEVVILDINVFSYLDVQQLVTLSVHRNDIEFSVLEPSLDGWKTDSNRFWQTYTARSKKPKRFRLAIRTNILGFTKIKIDAVGSSTSDSIEKQLKIIPEGIPKSITRSVLVLKNNSEIYSSTLKCVLPPTAVSDTTSASASVAGDLMSYMIQGLEKLIQMSGGCGEQNMIKFVPSIIALKYLESTNQVTEKLKSIAISYAESGYQNQMRYLQKDKSVSFWGYGGGSTWLTAYVALAFKLASSYITIDSALIENMFDYFVSKQNPDGSFREDGYVSSSSLQGLSGKGLAMTAFVSIVLSESIDKFPDFTTARNKALDYIALNVDEDNVYDLCISALALHLGGHVDADSVYEKMMEKSVETDDELKWEVAKTTTLSSYMPTTFNIEAAAYALRVVLNKDFVKSLKVVKYLVSQKTAYGGYSSSQDTVQALYSLSLFGSRLSIFSDSLNFILTPNVGKAINHQVNPNNSVTVQDYTLDSKAQQLDIFSNDKKPGNAIVTLTCKFNEVSDEAAPRFKVRTRLIRPCKNLLRHEICISFIDDDDVAQSNMALMTMSFPSGYVHDEDQLVSPIIRLLEKEDGGTKVNVYFESFTTNQTCFEIQSVQTSVVEELLSSYIEVVDYYSTDRRTQVSYNIPSDLPNCSDLPLEESTTTDSTTTMTYTSPSPDRDYNN